MLQQENIHSSNNSIDIERSISMKNNRTLSVKDSSHIEKHSIDSDNTSDDMYDNLDQYNLDSKLLDRRSPKKSSLLTGPPSDNALSTNLPPYGEKLDIPSIPIFDYKLLSNYLYYQNLEHFGFARADKTAKQGSSIDDEYVNERRQNANSTNYMLSITKYLTGLDNENKTADKHIVKTFKKPVKTIKRPKEAVPPMKDKHLSPLTKSTPYKGRHGTNPRCASCKTTKTPYWRDSWNQGFIMCNACGLRYSKFKKRCADCFYVPRKDDKGGKVCIHCGGQWVQ